MAQQNSAATDSWTAGRLVVLAVVTLTIAFTVIHFISNTGLNQP